MSDLHSYNVETADDRKARKARALARMAGKQGSELTSAERQLLDTIRAIGWDIQHRPVVNERSGEHWQHGRVAIKAPVSWSHSQR